MLHEDNSSSGNRGLLVERIAGWSARRRGLALVIWFGLIAAAVLASTFVGGRDAPNTDAGEAGRAQQVLRDQRGFEPVRENLLIQARAGDSRFADDPRVRRSTEDLVAALRATGAVAQVRSPLEPGGGDLVSADGRSGLVTFQLSGPAESVRPNIATVVTTVMDVQRDHPDVRLAQAGDLSLSAAVDEYIGKDLVRSHLLSLPVTLLILLVVFGSLAAAGIPVLLSLSVVAATFGLLQVIGKVIAVNSAASAMILLIGIAVGVDYSLFYLRRHREERTAGRDVADSLRITARTSGHVVVVSGITVILCLTGLLFTGLGVFRGLTIGTILIVGLAMVGSVTVLPALLSLLGRRLELGRIPWLGRGKAAARESRAWTALARTVVRRPLLCGGLAVVALVALALPAFGMHLQDPAATNSLPRSVPAVDSAVRMQEAFPGAPTPARVVLWDQRGVSVDRPEVRAAIQEMRGRITAADGLLAEPIAVVPVDRVLVLRIPLAGGGTDDTSNRALERLRGEVLPASFGDLDPVRYAVGGRTATPHDFAVQLADRTPIVFGFVLLLALVLLTWTFRSLTIPVVSIVLNLLSIGAAYGVVTWVFQGGHLTWLLDFTPYGGVVGWLPLFMFVMLFGLSMDYHIFILSRVRERWSVGGHARRAVIDGIAASAGVVTSAAVIMTAVFGVFITLTAIEYKMLGVGMAFAVIVDATVVRGVLLPAALSLLGDRAWWLPRWLGGKQNRDLRAAGTAGPRELVSQ